MTQFTDEQWQALDAAVERVGAKLRALHDGLAGEEHLALHLILEQGRPAGSVDEVAGYAYSLRLPGVESARQSLHPDNCSTMTINVWDPSTWPRPPFTV